MKYLIGLKTDKIACEVFRLALDPYITFGVLPDTIPKVHGGKGCDDYFGKRWKLVRKFLDDFASRARTGGEARKVVEAWMSEPDIAPVFARILSKDLRCGVQAKTVNKVVPGLIPTFEIALAAEGYVIVKDKKTGKFVIDTRPDGVEYPCMAEPKFDGVRLVALKREGVVSLVSRSGKPYSNFPNIEAAIQDLPQDNIMLDGEVAGVTFDSVMNVAHRKKGKDDRNLALHGFDILSLAHFEGATGKIAQTRRTEHVRSVVAESGTAFLCTVPHKIVKSEKEMLAYFTKMRKKGYEGLVLKKLRAPYSFARTAVWIKAKEWLSVEGIVVGFEEGTSKYKGKLGALKLKIDGVVTKAGTGYSDALRGSIWRNRKTYKGKMVEIKAQEKTKDGRFRFPVFLRFREDKD